MLDRSHQSNHQIHHICSENGGENCSVYPQADLEAVDLAILAIPAVAWSQTP
jgi:hypothetical protein